MKYFTKELWAANNSGDVAASRRAYEQGERNTREYLHQLERLKPRLNEQTHRFFTTENLHDGRLLGFTAGDGVDYDVRGPEIFDINAHRTSARMKVLGENLDVLYTLSYAGVRRVLFDYPTDDPLFHGEGAHVGDWGYDELTAADEDYLRHEILFASGTTILIEFKDFSYEKEGCEGARHL